MSPTTIVVLVVLALIVALKWRQAYRSPARVAEMRSLVSDGGLLLDVRTDGEFAAGHLPGAVNIPVGQLASRRKELGPRGRAIVVYCRSGARSGAAARILRGADERRVEDLGPMSNWRRALDLD